MCVRFHIFTRVVFWVLKEEKLLLISNAVVYIFFPIVIVVLNGSIWLAVCDGLALLLSSFYLLSNALADTLLRPSCCGAAAESSCMAGFGVHKLLTTPALTWKIEVGIHCVEWFLKRELSSVIVSASTIITEDEMVQGRIRSGSGAQMFYYSFVFFIL